MDHRKRSANLEPVVMLDEDDDSAESLNKLLKLDRNKFKTIQTEMRTKGQMLSQNWSDLFGLMSKYQAELLTRQDQLIDIESEIQMRKKNNDQENELEKVKLQLQAKDREIKSIHIDLLNKNAVLTRTQNELGRLKSDLRSKDRLIQKLQNQIQSDDSFSGTTDSPLTPKQVSGTATLSTTLSTVPVEQENTSNIQADVTGLGAHVSLKRSGSDDCVPSASDDECESFEPMEADVHDAGSIPQDGSTAEEVQPGTSGTDNSGQFMPQIENVTSLSRCQNANPMPSTKPSAAWPVLHYLLTKEGMKSANGANPSVPESAPVVPVGVPIPGPGFPLPNQAPTARDHHVSQAQGQLNIPMEGQGQDGTGVKVKVEPVDVEQGESHLRSLLNRPADPMRKENVQPMTENVPSSLKYLKMETGFYRCGSCYTDFPDLRTIHEHVSICGATGTFVAPANQDERMTVANQGYGEGQGFVTSGNEGHQRDGMFGSSGSSEDQEFVCLRCHIKFKNAVELLLHLNVHK